MDDVAVAMAKAAVVGIVATGSTVAVPEFQTIGIAVVGINHLGGVERQAIAVSLGAVEYCMHAGEELVEVVHLDKGHDDTGTVGIR